MPQGFLQSRLQAAFRKSYGRSNDIVCKFYCRYNNLVSQYNFPLGQMLSNVFHTNCEAVLDTLNLTTVRTVYVNWNYSPAEFGGTLKCCL
jgi:uncharacterized protein (DUF1697 family)